MNLTSCLREIDLAPGDEAEVERLQASFQSADGMTPVNAHVAAIDLVVQDAHAEKADLVTRIEAAGGSVPVEATPATELEPEAENVEAELIEQPLFALADTADTTPQSSINATIRKAIKPSLRAPMRERFAEWAQGINKAVAEDRWWEFKAAAFDQAAPVERLERARFGKLLDARDSAYKMYGLTKNLPGVMQQVFRTGIPVYRDGQFQIEPGRQGLMQIFEPLFNHVSGNRQTEFEAWAVAHRLSQRDLGDERGQIKSHLSDDEIAELLALDDKYDGLFSRVNADWQAFNKQALDLAVERGSMSQEMADLWQQYDYVPFYRAPEDLEGIGSSQGALQTKAGLDGQSLRSRRLKGHDTARVDSVMQNMVLNMAKIIDGVYKNETMRRIVGLANGVAMDRIPMSRKPIQISTEEIARALVSGGVIMARAPADIAAQGPRKTMEWMLEQGTKEVEAMTDRQREAWNVFFRPMKPPGDDVVSVMENGEPVYYRVTDAPLLKTIQQIGPSRIAGMVGSLFRGPRKLLTEMVTMDPGFMIANYLRDLGSTYIATDADHNPLSFLASSLGSAKAIADDEGLMARLRAAGGMTTGFYNPVKDDVTTVFRKEMERGADWTVVNSPRKAWQMYRQLGRISEQANRAAVAKAVIAKGGSMSEAAWQAMDVLNFTQRGSSSVVQTLAEVVPFFNARLQGLYKVLFRATTGSAAIGDRDKAVRAFMLKGGILAALSVLYALHYDDDDDFNKLPEWDKDTNWHIFAGDKHYRLPKPFELGLIFSTVPERLTRLMTGADKGDVVAQSLIGRGLMETLAMNPIPQAIKPLYEVYANRSMFTGRPIVGENLKGLNPEAQYHPWTSETARGIANIMGGLLPEWAKETIPGAEALTSPVRIQHLVRAYLGTMGTYVMAGVDFASRDLMGLPPAPARRVGGSNVFSPMIEGVVQRVYRGDPELARGNRLADELYDNMEKANALFRTINEYKRQGQIAEAGELMGENLNLFSYRKLLNETNAQLRQLNTMERAYRYNAGMSPEDKRAAIDNITRTRNRVLEPIAPILDSL